LFEPKTPSFPPNWFAKIKKKNHNIGRRNALKSFTKFNEDHREEQRGEWNGRKF
jgi:hypothetical protein